ncbi:MAG: hypothetical protein CBB97_13355 [Candidatus Endolissoclinum sp. TMED37]|nr:MAG: hypothetical protein CBB97_13355 [Candidatus Endolissoclinum sp. TMED37]
MHTDLPKTINEALKILAYNDYFWYSHPKTPNTQINAHPKDFETVKSLAEAQYAWTEKQAKLAVVILKRYLTKFQAHGMDIKQLLDNPQYEQPFRVINFEKSIEKFIDDDEITKIELKFPYTKKIISLVRMLKDYKDLPGMYAKYDGENKKWTFLHSDVTVYFLTLIAIRYDFKFITPELYDEYLEVKKEKCSYKKPVARLIGNEIIVDNAEESFYEYWNTNVKNEKPLIQVDRLKEFGISTQNLKVRSWTELGKKIALCTKTKAWINKNDYSRDQVIGGLAELNCFPLVIPVSGDPNTDEDADEWDLWLSTFERHGITAKNISFGFDIKQPKRRDEDFEYNDNIVGKMSDAKFQTLYEVYQLSKQFKYIDKETKIIFVRNRIPKTLIKSEIKPKCVLVTLGGGYYTSGTENLKRFLDSLPKMLYYNDHRPSNYDWGENVIMKL